MKAALVKSERKTEANLADENFPRIMKKLTGARKADDSIMGMDYSILPTDGFLRKFISALILHIQSFKMFIVFVFIWFIS